MIRAMNGKQVVVTGGKGALGSAVVELLRARRATVHLLDVPQVDATDEKQVADFYAGVPGLWATVNLIGGFAMAPVTATSLADFEKQWRLNTVTCFLACREAARHMKGGGRIVNVAARPVLQPAGGMIAYVAAKAGVAAITQSLGAELVGDGILVNAVVPSIIDSASNRAAMPKADHASWPKPAQIAETIAFLASPENTLTTGTLVPVYGRA
jgi:NAD(P)-dependent dehydrogenase (short-subunit alcohol dehydrogenase family)